MSRSTRAVLTLAAVTFALVASACADATGPQPSPKGTCDYVGSNTCLSHDYVGSNT